MKLSILQRQYATKVVHNKKKTTTEFGNGVTKKKENKLVFSHLNIKSAHRP